MRHETGESDWVMLLIPPPEEGICSEDGTSAGSGAEKLDRDEDEEVEESKGCTEQFFPGLSREMRSKSDLVTLSRRCRRCWFPLPSAGRCGGWRVGEPWIG
jgi:hypothetical protein